MAFFHMKNTQKESRSIKTGKMAPVHFPFGLLATTPSIKTIQTTSEITFPTAKQNSMSHIFPYTSIF